VVKNCTDCHYGITESTLTSQVMLPNLNSAAPGAKTCVDCHHGGNDGGERGAPATCATCHAFHDRTHERMTALKLPSPATQPAQ
jgi:nitrate/TMAO reductase-like tetraheme cytochrome c subunit